jgi:cardiolipin synthase A/B
VALPVESPAVEGQHESAQLLSGGDALFPRMLAAIDGARRAIHLEVYTMALDEVGRRFVDALERACQRHVRVRVVLDGFGSVEDGEDIATRLRMVGAQVTIFNPLSAWLRGKLFRNHRKILVVDGRIAFIGGINIAKAYASQGSLAGWADLAVAVEGPSCQWLEEKLAGNKVPDVTRGKIRIFLSGFGGGARLQRRYLRALRRANDRVYLAQAYFLPSAQLIRALVSAAKRGVEVTLLLAGRSDVPFARAATMRLHRQLLTAGVRIYEWDQSVLHAKAAAIDGQILLVGSFNLDPLSLVNLEALVEVKESPAVTAGERWMEARAAFSREVTLAVCQRSRFQLWFIDVLGLWAARGVELWARLSLPKRRPTAL